MAGKKVFLSAIAGAIFALILVELVRVFVAPSAPIYVHMTCQFKVPPRLNQKFYSVRFKSGSEIFPGHLDSKVSRDEVDGLFVSLVDIREETCTELMDGGLRHSVNKKANQDLLAVGWSNAWLGVDGFSINATSENSFRIRLIDHHGKSWRRVVELLQGNGKVGGVNTGAGALETARVAYERDNKMAQLNRFAWLCKENQFVALKAVLTVEDNRLLQSSLELCNSEELLGLFEKIQIETSVDAITVESNSPKYEAEVRLKVVLIFTLVCILFFVVLIGLKNSRD